MLFHVCHVIAFDQIRDLVMANFRMDVTAHFQGIQEWVVEQGTIRPGFRRGPVEEFQIERRIVCEEGRFESQPPFELFHRMLDSRFAAYVVSGDSRQLRDVWRDDHLRVDELAVGVDDSSVLDFHGTDFDEFRAIFRVEAGGFGVENDVVEQWRLQRLDASWIVASVFVPVAHWVFQIGRAHV